MKTIDIEVPTYQDLMVPTLQALAELGGSSTNEQIDRKVIEIAGLTEEQVAREFRPEQTQTGSLVHHRCAWARTYLGKAGLIDNAGRGQWSITADGRSVLDLAPADARDLVIDSDRQIRLEHRNSDAQEVRRASDPAYEPIYEVVSSWAEHSLLSGRSLFEPDRAVWKAEVVADLHHRFIEGMDEGSGTFLEKLAGQLEGASQETHLLTAELLFVHLLAVQSISRKRKLEILESVSQLAPQPFEIPDDLKRVLPLGIVGGGVGFNTNRFYLVSLLIQFAQRWVELSVAERREVLDDPWAFKSFVYSIPQERADVQRNALLFMLFPATFEDIVSADHKRRIVEAHSAVAGSDTDVDRQLLEARRVLGERFGPDFSWYSEEVRPTWDGVAGTKKSSIRSSPEGAAEVLESNIPDEERRVRFAKLAAEAIKTAHAVNPLSWSVSLRETGIALNIASNRSLSSMQGQLGVMLSMNEAELSVRADEVELADREIKAYRAPENCSWISTSDAEAFWKLIQSHHEDFIDAVTRAAVRKTPFWEFFSEDALMAIESLAQTELPRPPDRGGSIAGVNAWIVRMKRAGKREAKAALQRGDVRVFWPIDVSRGASLEGTKAAMLRDDPELSRSKLGASAGNLHRFITRIGVDDLVVLPDGQDLYLGTITSEAKFLTDEREWVRTVEWANPDSPIDRKDVSRSLYSRLKSFLTVSDVSDSATELLTFLTDEDEEAAPVPVARKDFELPAVDDDTAGKWMLDRAWLQDTVDMLQEKRQLIFYGPPGTGKTYLAEKLAEHIVPDPANYRIVQFHPSYGYEDFVEGFRPQVNPDGTMVYELRPGPLKQLAEEARQNPSEPYVLIVDEINRGNLAKIFGELYYLLEYRDQSIVLQYGTGVEDEFSLPGNLYVIGTMNTADRSIAMVDAAIRRRFWFLEFSPTASPIDGLLREWLERRKLDDRPALLLEELNKRLGESDYAIGPSYLMNEKVGDERTLNRIWNHAIMPLLTEHFYGQRGSTDRFTLSSLLRSIDDLNGASAERADTSVADDLNGTDVDD